MKRFFKKIRRKIDECLEVILEGGPRHPGQIFDARVEIPKRKQKENPHLTKWKAYTDHLFDLMVEGHDKSPAAMQTRDILTFHWDFMSPKEQSEAMAHYKERRVRYISERQGYLVDKEGQIRRRQSWRDLREEVEGFMSPKAN